MLRIREEHIEVLTEDIVKRLGVRLLSFLKTNAPAWCKDANDQEQKALVETIVEYAHQCAIFEEVHIQALILLAIEHDLTFPLPDHLHDRLSRATFEEKYRIDQLSKALSSKQELTKITLDSDMDALRKEHDG